MTETNKTAAGSSGSRWWDQMALRERCNALCGELQEMFKGVERADGGRHAAGAYKLRLPGDFDESVRGFECRHLLTETHLWRIERDRGDTETPPERRVPRTQDVDDLLLRCHAALLEKLAFTPDFEEGSRAASMRETYLRDMRETFAGLEAYFGVRAPEETIARLLGEGEEKTERRSA